MHELELADLVAILAGAVGGGDDIVEAVLYVAVLAADDTHLYVVLAAIYEGEVAALKLLVGVGVAAVPRAAAAPRVDQDVSVVVIVKVPGRGDNAGRDADALVELWWACCRCRCAFGCAGRGRGARSGS